MQCEAVATSNGLQDWYYGHRNKDSSAVYNYTEYRIIKAFLYVCSDLKGDINRIFQYGSSMGGSGSLTLAERYPSVISAAFCCQPQTDWSNTSAVWYGEAPLNYGPPSQNLPIYNIPFEDPAYPEIDSNLQRYNGTPVYDWQNVREQLIVRAEADMALICATHGTADESIDWPTQGAPFGPVLRNSRRPFKYVVNGSGHNWQGFNAVNFSQMFTTGGCYENGCPYAFECDKSIPGFSGIDESNTLVSASWTVVADSTDVWSMTISGVGQTCDITPRRCQSFCAYPDDRFDVFVGGALHQSNVTADAAGLVTATNVNLSSTQTIRIVSTYRNPMRATSTVSVPAEERDIQAFPNPFNPDVRIRFYNPKKDHVLMTIYSIDGTLIKKAMDRNLPAGIFASAYWDGTDISNKKVPSGIYVVKLTMLGVNRVTRIMKIQ